MKVFGRHHWINLFWIGKKERFSSAIKALHRKSAFFLLSHPPPRPTKIDLFSFQSPETSENRSFPQNGNASP